MFDKCIWLTYTDAICMLDEYVYVCDCKLIVFLSVDKLNGMYTQHD